MKDKPIIYVRMHICCIYIYKCALVNVSMYVRTSLLLMCKIKLYLIMNVYVNVSRTSIV